MSLLSFLKNRASKNDDFKDAQRREKIQEILNERKKSSNERVLDKMMEEERQKKITEQMKAIQKQRNDELFSGGMSPEKNVFQGHKNILDQDKSIIGNTNSHGGNMFFK